MYKNLKYRFFALVILAVSFAGCRVMLVPPYDVEIARQIDEVSKQVDKLYLTMLETTSNENGGRKYAPFSGQYIDVEVELNSLLTKNKIRPLNGNTVKVCEITLNLWIKYKEEHKKDNGLSDGVIKANRLYMSDMFYTMRKAEEGKKLTSNK
jgi:hypothetical protein